MDYKQIADAFMQMFKCGNLQNAHDKKQSNIKYLNYNDIIMIFEK